MVTSEQKTELVETLKGPRYYRLTIGGYGGESAYMSISKKAFEFWKAHCEEHGDSDLVEYMIADDVEDCEFDELQDVPSEAQFLNDADDDDYKRPWYESHTEFEHTYGATYDSAWIAVEEVTDDDYNADVIAEVVDQQDLSEYLGNVEEENDYAVELTDMGCCDEPEEPYIAQLYSSEKGQFVEGLIETIGEFDPKKLKIYTTEYLNGEDTITEVHYDGVEVDNMGGDTNGKGYYATVWAN